MSVAINYGNRCAYCWGGACCSAARFQTKLTGVACLNLLERLVAPTILSEGLVNVVER